MKKFFQLFLFLPRFLAILAAYLLRGKKTLTCTLTTEYTFIRYIPVRGRELQPNEGAPKLFLGIGGNHHCDNRKHHALVTGRQIVEELLGFLSLKLHIIRDNGAEIVVLILLSLPIRDIRLDTEQTVFDLAYCFIGRDGDNINGKHQVSVQLGKLRHHAVLDIARVVFEEKHSRVFLTQLDMVCGTLDTVRTDIITVVMTETGFLADIHLKCRFISGTIEVVENTQPFHRVQSNTLAELMSSDEKGDEHRSKILDLVRKLHEQSRYLLKKYRTLRQTRLYRYLKKSKGVTNPLNETNILLMDKHYNVVFKLWKDIHKEIAPQEVTEENAVKFSDTLSDYLLFCKTLCGYTAHVLNFNIEQDGLYNRESDNGILFLGIQRTKRSKKSPSVGDGGRFLRRSYSPTYSASRSERSFASSFISR